MLIGAGDLLEVSVYGAPEYLRQARVDSQGNVALPLIGPVHVGGLTVENGEKEVAKRLMDGGFFNDPAVTILEKEFATQGISVLGEVQKPGIYPMPGAHTLFDAISAAGGTTPRAGNTATVTHRDRPKEPETVTLVYDGKGGLDSNIQVNPGDTVVVSKAGVVYVVGDVRMPTGVVMENSKMTILQAIAMAQGTNPTAALDHARLIRRSPGGPQEIPVPLKKIMAAKAPDMPLEAEDILFVPNSAAKGAAHTTLNAIVQAATGLAIYAPRY
jgi:polysaccharide export outer membrane protein